MLKILRPLIVVVITAALIAVAIWLRTDTRLGIINSDELIPIEVSSAMAARGDLNPNWALANLPDMFRYDSYNFYLYNVLVHPVAQAATAAAEDPLGAVRQFNVVFQLIAAAAIFFAASAPGFPKAARWIALAAFGIAPLVVQDAHMARPESLLYALSALAMLVALRLPAAIASCAVLGLLLGLGAAVKISFLSLGILAIPLIAPDLRPSLAAIVRAGVLGAACCGAFLLAQPYAVVHPEVFASGVDYLLNQYGGAHPPHSLIQHSYLRFAFWVISYVAMTFSGLFIAALAMPVLLRKPMPDRVRLAAIWLSFTVLFAYFTTKSVFFERNLSHVIPELILCAAWALASIRSTALKSTAVFAALAVPAFWSYQIAIVSKDAPDVQKLAHANGILSTQKIYFMQGEDAAQQCLDHLAVFDYSDEYSAAFIDRLDELGFKQVAHHKSRFDILPPSTLQAYLDAGVRFFRCPPDGFPSGDEIILDQALDIDGVAMEPTFAESGWPDIEALGQLPEGAVGWASYAPLGDVGQGRLRLQFTVPANTSRIGVPVLNGPTPTNTSYALTDEAGVSIATLVAPKSPAWRVWQVDLPPLSRAQSLSLEVIDNGQGWGEWAGVGQPYAMTR